MEWKKTIQLRKNINLYFKNIELDQYIIMPNYFHGIIYIGAGAEHSAEKDTIKCKKAAVNAWPLQMACGTNSGSLGAMPNHIHGIIVLNDKYNRRGTMYRAPTMGTIIRSFKSAVTPHLCGKGTAGRLV